METDKRIDKIANSVFNKNSIESVSPDFTDNIMSEILEHKTSIATSIKPIISKSTWYLIISIITAVIVLSVVFIPEKSTLSTIIPYIDFEISRISIPNINYTPIDIGRTSFFSIIFFGIFFMIQLIIIDKKKQQYRV